MERRLVRSKDNAMLAGVCGGLGEYLNIDPTLVRLVWTVLCLAGGSGVLAYILAAFIIPSYEEL